MTTTDMEQDTGTRQNGRMSAASAKMRERTSAARTRASDAYGSARERASTAYESARERASSARRTTVDSVDTNPVAALVGGLALGALIAAILPRTRREEEMFGQYGRRLNHKAIEAARAARDAGTSKLDEMGVNRESAKQRLNELTSNAGEAARTSAGAAAQTLRRKPPQ